jgi:hypothetical protein
MPGRRASAHHDVFPFAQFLSHRVAGPRHGCTRKQAPFDRLRMVPSIGSGCPLRALAPADRFGDRGRRYVPWTHLRAVDGVPWRGISRPTMGLGAHLASTRIEERAPPRGPPAPLRLRARRPCAGCRPCPCVPTERQRRPGQSARRPPPCGRSACAGPGRG